MLATTTDPLLGFQFATIGQPSSLESRLSDMKNVSQDRASSPSPSPMSSPRTALSAIPNPKFYPWLNEALAGTQDTSAHILQASTAQASGRDVSDPASGAVPSRQVVDALLSSATEVGPLNHGADQQPQIQKPIVQDPSPPPRDPLVADAEPTPSPVRINSVPLSLSQPPLSIDAISPVFTNERTLQRSENNLDVVRQTLQRLHAELDEYGRRGEETRRAFAHQQDQAPRWQARAAAFLDSMNVFVAQAGRDNAQAERSSAQLARLETEATQHVNELREAHETIARLQRENTELRRQRDEDRRCAVDKQRQDEARVTEACKRAETAIQQARARDQREALAQIKAEEERTRWKAREDELVTQLNTQTRQAAEEMHALQRQLDEQKRIAEKEQERRTAELLEEKRRIETELAQQARAHMPQARLSQASSHRIHSQVSSSGPNVAGTPVLGQDPGPSSIEPGKNVSVSDTIGGRGRPPLDAAYIPLGDPGKTIATRNMTAPRPIAGSSLSPTHTSPMPPSQTANVTSPRQSVETFRSATGIHSTSVGDVALQARSRGKLFHLSTEPTTHIEALDQIVPLLVVKKEEDEDCTYTKHESPVDDAPALQRSPSFRPSRPRSHSRDPRREQSLDYVSDPRCAQNGRADISPGSGARSDYVAPSSSASPGHPTGNPVVPAPSSPVVSFGRHSLEPISDLTYPSRGASPGILLGYSPHNLPQGLPSNGSVEPSPTLQLPRHSTSLSPTTSPQKTAVSNPSAPQLAKAPCVPSSQHTGDALHESVPNGRDESPINGQRRGPVTPPRDLAPTGKHIGRIISRRPGGNLNAPPSLSQDLSNQHPGLSDHPVPPSAPRAAEFHSPSHTPLIAQGKRMREEDAPQDAPDTRRSKLSAPDSPSRGGVPPARRGHDRSHGRVLPQRDDRPPRSLDRCPPRHPPPLARRDYDDRRYDQSSENGLLSHTQHSEQHASPRDDRSGAPSISYDSPTYGNSPAVGVQYPRRETVVNSRQAATERVEPSPGAAASSTAYNPQPASDVGHLLSPRNGARAARGRSPGPPEGPSKKSLAERLSGVPAGDVRVQEGPAPKQPYHNSGGKAKKTQRQGRPAGVGFGQEPNGNTVANFRSLKERLNMS